LSFCFFLKKDQIIISSKGINISFKEKINSAFAFVKVVKMLYLVTKIVKSLNIGDFYCSFIEGK